ncbi:MAG: iduronate sulfatase, partial [Verrucomicrobiae bacterium]|nr:iduronate sulfatase [Verrucomicrobiae bacterium]
RTDHYRYVQWKDWKSGKTLAEELYDHQTDPNEMLNVADDPDQAASLFQHRRILEGGWKGALPLRMN